MEMAQKRDHCVPVPSVSNTSASSQIYIVRPVTMNISRAAAGAKSAAVIHNHKAGNH